MQITQKGLELVKKYEGFSAIPYKCPTGYTTIGYGHRIKPGENFTSISPAEGNSLLLKDLEIAGQAVKKHVKVPINNDQYSALASWFLNLGENQSTVGSSLIRYLNDGRQHLVPGQFGVWIIGKVNGNPTALPGLIKRRRDEALLFISKLDD